MANAGIGAVGSVLEIDPEAFKTVIDVNLMGVFYTVRAALQSVIERRGYVLVVSSLPRSRRRPAWPPTTPRRRASSTSPTRCGLSSHTAESMSGRAHVMDRHAAGPGEQGVVDLR